jgi:F-type H+/Na+-transporting ATPase subunit alpha
MKDFDYYLNQLGEIGFVEEIMHSIVYASGLPRVQPGELILFESGDLGEVFSLAPEKIEVLLLTKANLKVGSKLVRTATKMKIPVGAGLLGRSVDPLGNPLDGKNISNIEEYRVVDVPPAKIIERVEVQKPLATGVTLVDLVVPLGKGQRELVIGDRKVGKTEFIIQTLTTQAKLGTVCIYAIIGQNQIDIKRMAEVFRGSGVGQNIILVASASSDTAGVVFLTPYTAMTVAEYFRDKGMDVLIILDDMTTHARNYREISLLAKRFPGRASYPGDIFYAHARLIERAGNFKKGSITALPVAESILGDLSGYIQTNLMAMTDGHIFFDIELYNQGKRPAINPFLSVTRVGHQTQTELQKDLSRELSSFLVTYEKMKQFVHFGAEVGDTAKNILSLGSKVDLFFNQGTNATVPISINIIILSSLWSGIWTDANETDLRRQMEKLVLAYNTDGSFKKQADDLIDKSKSFSDIVNYIRRNNEFVTSKF